MSTAVLPTKIAISAVALSVIGTLRVLSHLNSAQKIGFYAVVDATGTFVIILGLVGYSTKLLLGSDNLVHREYIDGDGDSKGTLGKMVLKKRRNNEEPRVDEKMENMEDSLVLAEGDDGEYDDLPDSSEERRKRQLKKRPKVKAMGIKEKRERRIAMMNRKDEIE